MNVLVTAASHHGGTQGIAQAIVEQLANLGLEVGLHKPGDVKDLAGYKAAVIGSAIYMGHRLSSPPHRICHQR